MPALKFLATVFHDTSGRLAASIPFEDYAEADRETTKLVSNYGTAEHTGWVYKRVRANSPNKAWAISITNEDLELKTKVVTDCANWFEALCVAFPEETDGTEWTDETRYTEAQQEANDSGWGFTCEVIDETKL